MPPRKNGTGKIFRNFACPFENRHSKIKIQNGCILPWLRFRARFAFRALFETFSNRLYFTPQYLAGKLGSGSQAGNAFTFSRAAGATGIRHAVKNGPRFLPVICEKRTST